ncbi:MAG: hypothetical protein KIT84_24530 [Labilithrix sp.]|nr:hypothetical protein [Labilithrix sp.]MCW5814216.1 hypothetical protein [Labilithrix sp.]
MSGCGVGADSAKTERWAAESRVAIAKNAPVEDEKIKEQLEYHRKRSAEIVGKHAEQAMTSNDVILGVKGFNNLEAAPFDQHVAFLRKHKLMPTPVPANKRRMGKFFEQTSKENMDRMVALSRDAQAKKQLGVAVPTVDALGAYLLKEQEGTTGVSWSTELAAMQYAAMIVAFEHKTESKASDALVGELAQMMSLRDQARLQMATHTAMLASFEGVVHGGDPKAVMDLAAASKKQINEAPKVSLESAREFARQLSKQSLDIAASLEATMRAAHGDAEYERHYQGELVRTLGEIEKAEGEASLYTIVDQTQKRARMAELEALAKNVKERLIERAKSLGLEKAESILSALPFGKQIVSGIKAVKALVTGHPREALAAAIDAVPPGPIQEGMKSAVNIGFAIEKRLR